MDCFQPTPRGNVDICALSHTHETCMETLEQSYVTKPSKKQGEAIEHISFPQRLGELGSAVGEL